MLSFQVITSKLSAYTLVIYTCMPCNTVTYQSILSNLFAITHIIDCEGKKSAKSAEVLSCFTAVT